MLMVMSAYTHLMFTSTRELYGKQTLNLDIDSFDTLQDAL